DVLKNLKEQGGASLSIVAGRLLVVDEGIHHRPDYRRQLQKCFGDARVPGALELAQVFVVFVKTGVTGGKAVHLIDHQLNRRAYGEVGAHGGIHGHQSAERSRIQPGFRFENAVEDGLAVFAFANLQVGSVLGGGDVVALGVNQHDARFVTGNLAA